MGFAILNEDVELIDYEKLIFTYSLNKHLFVDVVNFYYKYRDQGGFNEQDFIELLRDAMDMNVELLNPDSKRVNILIIYKILSLSSVRKVMEDQKYYRLKKTTNFKLDELYYDDPELITHIEGFFNRFDV